MKKRWLYLAFVALILVSCPSNPPTGGSGDTAKFDTATFDSAKFEP
jgi:hypothetical protein